MSLIKKTKPSHIPTPVCLIRCKDAYGGTVSFVRQTGARSKLQGRKHDLLKFLLRLKHVGSMPG